MALSDHIVKPSRPGKMSQDRVHFSIPARDLEKKNYKAVIEETLGIAKGSYDTYKDLKIICRPSQFARFVILRHVKYGEANNMAGLNMKLVKPEQPQDIIDCSRNPNTAVGEVAT